MNDQIDFDNLKRIDSYEYDITPNEQGEMMIVFKAGDDSYVLPISVKDLRRMVWFGKRALGDGRESIPKEDTKNGS